MTVSQACSSPDGGGGARGVVDVDADAHLVLLLDHGPGRGAGGRRAVRGRRAAVPARVLAGHARAVPRALAVAAGHGESRPQQWRS